MTFLGIVFELKYETMKIDILFNTDNTKNKFFVQTGSSGDKSYDKIWY